MRDEDCAAGDEEIRAVARDLRAWPRIPRHCCQRHWELFVNVRYEALMSERKKLQEPGRSRDDGRP